MRGQQAEHPVQPVRVDGAPLRQFVGGDGAVLDVVGDAEFRHDVQASGGHARVGDREDQLVRLHGGTYPIRAGARVRETHASNPSSDGLSRLASRTSRSRQ